MEAPGLDDEARAARGDEGPAAGIDPEPAEDGISRPVRRLDARIVERDRARHPAREPRAVDELLRAHADGRTEGGDRIWTLLNLELWHRTFIDGEGVQTLPHAHS